VVAPAGLPDGYRPTSARTDAGSAEAGDPVTLEVGYLTPSSEYAGFVVSDDARADAVTDVLDGARSRAAPTSAARPGPGDDGARRDRALPHGRRVTVLVTGSATDEELETVAGAVRPYSG
jgi:hypothetical protein